MMNELFANNPLLLLFVVAAIGYFIGSVRIKGISLGVSAVLFVGLGFGIYNPNFNVPDIVFQLGLILFIYSIGISSGPAFFQSFNKSGYRDILFVVVMLTITFGLAIGVHYFLDLDVASTVGVYTGSTTNTTALAAAIELAKQSNVTEQIQGLVVGYTYSYPMGVIGVMIILKLCEKVLKVDYTKERLILKKKYNVADELGTVSIRITKPEFDGRTIRDISKGIDKEIVFGRIKKNSAISLTHWDTIVDLGDELMVIAAKEDFDDVAAYFGERVKGQFHHDRSTYDVRRIFVSNQEVVGKQLATLNLSEKYDAVITRIRRGDIDMLARPDTTLEMGDRIRFVARREDLTELAKFFGDSYFDSSKVNLFSFGLGLALGLILGTIEFSLPGGLNFKLGYAGGPLLVALFLGYIRRTGPIVWILPYGANVTLRQIGLILFLAVIGLRSGNSFLESLSSSFGYHIFAAGAILSMFTAFISIIIGYKLFKIPFTMLLGYLSNQPAILDFSLDMSRNRIPIIGYTIMFPIALIMKILFAQVLYLVLS